MNVGGALPTFAFGLNHMTAPCLSTRGLFDVARSLGCVGVELRNDLEGQPFDGSVAAVAIEATTATDLTILGLAEVKSFNLCTEESHSKAEAVMAQAAACGAAGVALILHVGNALLPRHAQGKALSEALQRLQPLLERCGLRGFIEPLGFPKSTLRHNDDVIAVLDEMGHPECFGIIHDTFHHCLSGDQIVYAKQTAMVHISGVTNADVSVFEMTDAHRVLVDQNDRLGNVSQLCALVADGYRGPVSFEAFAPEIHDLTDPTEALAGSIAFITQRLHEETAGDV